MKISVFGIGYVGAVTSACLADTGHHVVAVDMEPVKVKCILEGRSPIIEKDLDTTIAKAVANGSLTATGNCEEAVLATDMSLICVGTPSNKDGSLKLDYVADVCEQIGKAIAKKGTYHVVVVRSTVVPGTCMNFALPILEKASGLKGGKDFGFGNNPEFLRESTAIFDYYNPPKIVVGALDDKTATAIMSLYDGIEAPRIVCDVPVGEGVKYVDNAWHAMKVGFANEVGNILKEHDIDSHKVMNIFFQDVKLNISKAYLLPGFAFGGSCLPKDVRAIRASAKTKNLNTPIFDALLNANDEQVMRAFNMIKQSGKTKIAMMGLSFKAGTDDLRESPLVTLADKLLDAGYDLKIYDPNVFEASTMDGANQKYIVEGIPHIHKCLVENADQVTGWADIFVIGNGNEDFATILNSANDNAAILDLVRLKDKSLEEKENYSGICW